jgi:hypothetical protein
MKQDQMVRKPRNPLRAELLFKDAGRHGAKRTNKQNRAAAKQQFRKEVVC